MSDKKERDHIDEIIDDFFDVRQKKKEEEERRVSWDEFGRELRGILQGKPESQEKQETEPQDG